jgi:hypothetical protein
MTEKITITGAFQKGLTKKGNPFFTLNLADGRQATCFDAELSQKLNQEIEVDIKQTEYNGQVEYVVNAPGNGQRRGGGFNLDYNQRKTALETATASIPAALGNGAEILTRADKFLEWIQR